eukprot:2161755-Pleurochrysis_carterae.AAC.1
MRNKEQLERRDREREGRHASESSRERERGEKEREQVWVQNSSSLARRNTTTFKYLSHIMLNGT